MLLAWLAEGRQDKVAAWWRQELRKKVVPAEILLPALPSDIVAQAKGLAGDAPAAPASGST